MDFASDGDLYQKISAFRKSKTTFGEEQVWKIVLGAVSGLAKLHRLNIFHRDIKSANIFLTENGQALLGDLNVSKVAKDGLLYTQTGTPYYASPEVWNDTPYDSKSDIWSLGCVLYETLTLYPPFRAQDMNSLYKRVIKGNYEEPPAMYSKDIKKLINSMLVVKSESRPSCEQILNSPEFQRAVKRFNLDESVFYEFL
jgi:NIMA (never in mitosis gene a)-related kinase 1/4/5